LVSVVIQYRFHTIYMAREELTYAIHWANNFTLIT